jgi:DNA repair protein RadA/Sms
MSVQPTRHPQPVPGSYPCKMSGCGALIPPDKYRCPKCKTWNVPDISCDDDGETVLLSDAKETNVRRYETGMLDPVFGGGLVDTSVALLGGPPGAGKTTLFLQLADSLCDQTNRECLYIANEQSADEIKVTAMRIQLRHLNRIRVYKAMGGMRTDLRSLVTKHKPCLMILDSLTKLTGDDPKFGLLVCQAMKACSVDFKAPGLIVNQINKDGDHAGIMKLQHEVDAVYFLEKDNETGERMFYSEKNRHGQAPKFVELIMTPEDALIPGMLMPKPPGLDDEDEDDES